MEVKCCLQIHKELNGKHTLFAGKATGLESVWILGDEFVHRSYVQHYKHATNEDKSKPYMIEHYDVHFWATTRYSSSIRNILALFEGLLALAIKEKCLLPKAVVIIPDDDIIKQLKFNGNYLAEF